MEFKSLSSAPGGSIHSQFMEESGKARNPFQFNSSSSSHFFPNRTPFLPFQLHRLELFNDQQLLHLSIQDVQSFSELQHPQQRRMDAPYKGGFVLESLYEIYQPVTEISIIHPLEMKSSIVDRFFSLRHTHKHTCQYLLILFWTTSGSSELWGMKLS